MPRPFRAPAGSPLSRPRTVFPEERHVTPASKTTDPSADESSAVERANITTAAMRLQARALRGETVVLRLGPLVLFCARFDAWMLDPTAGMARCLAKSGEKLALGIVECGRHFRVRWNATYWIEDNVFNVMQFGADQQLALVGYPMAEIAALLSEPVRN
jgi:hypothetical protein